MKKALKALRVFRDLCSGLHMQLLLDHFNNPVFVCHTITLSICLNRLNSSYFVSFILCDVLSVFLWF